MIGWIALLGARPAAAWEPGTWTRVDLPTPPDEIALGRWAGRGVLFARAGEELSAWSVEDGSPLGSLALPGIRGILLHDLDGDEDPELLVCASDGISLVRPVVPLGGKRVALWAGACGQVVAFDSGQGWPALGVVANDEIIRLDPGPAGLSASVLEPGGGRLAAGGAMVLVWRDLEVVTFEGGKRASYAAPSALTHLASGVGVAFAAEGGIGWVGAAPTAIEGRVLSLAIGREPGEAWAGTSDSLVRVDAQRAASWPAGGDVAVLAVGDPSADGCTDVAIASAGLARVAIGTGVCAPAPTSAPVPNESGKYENKLPGILADVRCELLAGWAYGLWDSAVDGSSAWSQVGDDGNSGPERENGIALGSMCTGGRSAWRWAAGIGSAPSIYFGSKSPSIYADVGAEVGSADVAVGPLVEVGLPEWVAVGGRLRIAPIHGKNGRPIGAELRILGVPGATAGFVATASISYGLGRYRPIRREAW